MLVQLSACSISTPKRSGAFEKHQAFAEVDAALKAFNRHLWYLTAELIALALSDEGVLFAEKEALSTTLLNLSPNPNLTMLKRCGNGFGKPLLPDIKSQHASMSLSHYTNEDGGKIFKFLHIPLTFLEQPVTEAYFGMVPQKIFCLFYYHHSTPSRITHEKPSTLRIKSKPRTASRNGLMMIPLLLAWKLLGH